MNRAFVGMLLVLLLGAVALAQEEGVLFYADFEKDTCGFTTLDKEATLSVTHEADLVYKGKGALQLAFPQRSINLAAQADLKALPGSVELPAPASVKDLKAISFAVAAFHSTPLIVSLSEGDKGPRYVTSVWCEAGEWHRCTLSLDQFRLDMDGPPDPDGKLRPEKVKTIGILDFGGLLRSIVEMVPVLYTAPPADQTLWLDEFKLLSTAPAPLPEPADGVRLANYKAPAVGLFILGGKGVTVTDEDDDQGQKAAKIEYTLPPRTILAVAHLLPPGLPSSLQALRFRAKSSGTVTLIVDVEEKHGPGAANSIHYNAGVTVPGMKPWQTFTVPISSLKPQGDQANAGARPDFSKVDTVAIVDVSGMEGAAQIKNTLWLDDFVAVK